MMKVLLYSESQKMLKKSGIGRALYHQQRALELNGIEWTTNKHDSYDVVHINTLFKKSYKFMRKCQKKGIPVITHAHSTKEDFRNSFRFWKLISIWFYHRLTKMYKNSTNIITPSIYSKNLILGYNIIKCPIYAISNGIELERFNYDFSLDELEETRKKYNLNKKVVIGIGLFFERKGLHDFIAVAKTMPDTSFIWLGEKYKLLTTHKINKAVKNKPGNVILPGYISGDEFKKIFKLSDCFFFPSYEETEGIVVLEALASKKPVVLRNIGVFEPWLTDKVNCYKGNNNEEFRQLIIKVINSDNTQMVNNGYKIVEERTLDIIGLKFKEVYENAINHQK